MKLGFIALLAFCSIWLLYHMTYSLDDDNMRHFVIGSDLEDRARIIMVNGNVYFYSGSKKNISFVSNAGGKILLGGVDVRMLPNKTQIETLNVLLSSNSELMTNLHSSVSATERAVPQLKREITEIKLRQSSLAFMVRRMNDTRTRNRNNRRIRAMVTKLNFQLDRLYKLMKTNECLSAPCKNGATCIDLFGDYKCWCPRHFTGKHCQEKEDECAMYSGTHAGCQNNATCINRQNSVGFVCNCTSGWHGPLCQYEQSTCNKFNNLCGEHGQCVERVLSNNKVSYDCICEWGYKRTADPLNPTCIDIDECANAPCYPGSNCLNLPGSFKCESCPAGFVGNGVNCADFDECASKLTHDCSKNPEVECLNTAGSYKCGNCPTGYIGDGFKCEKQRYCDSDPCFATAKCVEHESACMCPFEYTGDGLKKGSGCKHNYYYECALSCENGGSCRGVTTADGKYNPPTCFCPLGFYGPRCQYVDLCAQADYCSNRGTCVRNGNSASCECFDGFYDDRCQTSESAGCSFHTSNETGVVEFTPSTDATTASTFQVNNVTIVPSCAWVIKLQDTRKVIELWFDYFEQEETNSTCDQRDSLIIFDSTTKPIDMLGDMCRDGELPRNNTPIYSAGNSLSIHYFFMNTKEKSRIKMNWKAVEPLCGGRLIQEAATFEFTSTHAFQHCVWYVSTKAGFYLDLNVESFVTVSGKYRNCSVNSLEVYDDSFLSDDAQKSLQTCQTESTHRRLSGRNAVIRLNYNSYNASKEQLDECRMSTGAMNNTDEKPRCKIYFRLSYKSVPLPEGCGSEIKLLDPGSMEASVGYLESPNYQHAYFSNLNCLWSLDSTNAFNNSLIQDLGMIRLEFTDLDVDSDGLGRGLLGDSKCPGDYIKFSTRPGERFCNANPPKLMFAKERVQIEFITTDQNRYKSRGRGFQIKYQTICYQELSGENGTIQSPNYRVPSPVPFKCHYHIVSNSQSAVQLNFDYIGLKPFSLACVHPRWAKNQTDDYVEFAGGHSSNIQINKRYYCSRYPFSTPNGEFVVSGTKGLSFVYSTSGDKDNTGFLFRYTVQNIGCGGYSIGMKGTIKSPNYPEHYPPHMYCIYNVLLFKPGDLNIHSTHGIRLTFDVFNVENVASREDCGFDVVKVYDHYRSENDHGKLLGQFCGLKQPPPVLSEVSTLAVVFMSDRSVSGTGFTAHWEAIDLKFDCDRVYMAQSGLIEFNSHDFERVSSCDYRIVLPVMNRVELTIENVTMPCDEGRIMFRNGGDETAPAFSGLFGDSEMCNGQVIERLQSQGNQVFIRIRIPNTQHASFRIRYEQLASGCGGYMRGFAGAISAPQYPQEDSRMLNCEWQIAVALGNTIRLQFIKIDNLDSADRSGVCAPFARNFIDILGSVSPDAHILKRYCRTDTAPDPIDSDDNQLVVRYNQNGGSINGGLYGFLAQYQTVCEYVELTSAHGSIQSPGYPLVVSENRKCRWTIRTTPGSYIKVTFHEFDIENAVDSTRQYLHMGLKSCAGNFLEVERAQINQTIGTIQDTTANSITETRWCNQGARPMTVYTKSNELVLRFQTTEIPRHIFTFKSHSNKPKNHFWLSWSTIGCGGQITQNGTDIHVKISDFVDTSLSELRECKWFVRAPLGMVPEVNIEKLYTEGNLNTSAKQCFRDKENPDKFSGLEFFYGSEPTDYVQKEFCGIDYEDKFTAHSNEILIRLRFNGSHLNSANGTVFKSMVTFIKTPTNNTCGAAIFVPTTTNITIYSPNYPKAYPRNIECIWQFETLKGFTISYRLVNYTTPNHHAKQAAGTARANQYTKCSYALGHIEGNIAFYSTAYNLSHNVYTYGITRNLAIQRICLDIQEPIVITSGSNVSSVVFNGAPYEASVPSGVSTQSFPIGFQLEVFAVCGGTLYAGATRQLHWLSSEHLSTNQTECLWVIERKDDNEDAERPPIYARFELLANKINARNGTTLEVTVSCGNSVIPIELVYSEDLDSAQEAREVKCDTPISVKVPKPDSQIFVVVSYDTESAFCGGTIEGLKGATNMGKLKGSIECEWNFQYWKGNSVEVRIGDSYIDPSDYCAQSFVELRRHNKSGTLIARRCGEISGFTFEGSDLYLRLRRVLNEDAGIESEDSANNDADNEEDGEMASDAVSTKEANFKFSYAYKFGGYTTSPIITIPRRILDFVDRTNPDNERLAWLLVAKNSTSFIRIHLSEQVRVELWLLNYHCPMPCLYPEEPAYLLASGQDAHENNKDYLIQSNVATVLAIKLDCHSKFTLEWQEVSADPDERETESPATTQLTDFTCGGELTPTYMAQSLKLPVNSEGFYGEGMRCKWIVKRPMLASIVFNLKKLDLEQHPECLYDYVVFSAKNFDTLTELTKSLHTNYCRKDQVGMDVSVNYDDNAYIYFVSDVSSSYTGFTVEYRIGCRTFEYIPASNGLFDMILESPSYPDTSRYNYSCLWGMMLESNRDVMVTSLDMNLAPKAANGSCIEDVLKIGDFPSSFNSQRNIGEFCGDEPFNFTAKAGRIYIQFDKPVSSAIRRGYRLRISEVVHECSSQVLHVDEHTKSATLTSPNFPHLAPNSLDCRWTLSVPAGHQLKFTMDHTNFNLQNSRGQDDCFDDYIEIHDGASEGAPLIGKYCNQNPPSTIISSDSHLFVRFVTDNFASSFGWNATFELASCGGTVILQSDHNSTVTSPHFPDVYPTRESCEWVIRPPKAHYVYATINSMWFFAHDNCSDDYLSLREDNKTGRYILPPTCSYRNVNQTGYYLNGNGYLRFQSNSSSQRFNRIFCLHRKCGFEMEFAVSKFECGGLITDEEGERYLQTNSQNQIIPGLSCKFEFKAGIGYRYKIDFFWLSEDENNHGFYQRTNMYNDNPFDWCFPDLEVWNGLASNRYNLFGMHQRFCRNRTSFVSSSDIMSMQYEDNADYFNMFHRAYHIINETRFRQPFGFRYTKIDADYDQNACMYHVMDDTQLAISNMKAGGHELTGDYHSVAGQTKSFCHIRIDNPLRMSTFAIHFSNFSAGRKDVNMCGAMDNKVMLTDSGTHSWPINEVLCTANVKNGSASFIYNNPSIDVFVQNNPYSYFTMYDGTVNFNVSVQFHACGGFITEDEDTGNSGTITSPGWGRGNYTNSADCLWTLQAPEGKVVSLNFTFMDIEHQGACVSDYLEVSEGEDRHAVINRYCYSMADEEQRIPDRWRSIKSHGRYLTLYFHSDATIAQRGFSVNWEFISYDNQSCGFTSHSRTGVIHSPNFPNDYPFNLECQWFIVVPSGHHIKLTFHHMDIEESDECAADQLAISQEHQARDFDPQSVYYFYYDHEEVLNRTCGSTVPKSVVSESNQMRINFTTDGKITARGFNLTWEAECGTVFKTSHGVVTSPYYPRFYPNENLNCNYMIIPEGEGIQILTLRIVDYDLDTTLGFFPLSTTRQCNSDYLEILDVERDMVLQKVCGSSLNDEETGTVFSVKGPIGIKFVANASMLHDFTKSQKNHRGFKITYALSDCGGEITLSEAHGRLAGTINSPGYPLPYHDDMDCTWNVSAPHGYIIAVKFTAMDLETTVNCSYDYVEVFDGAEMSNETSFGRVCGRKAPQGHRRTTGNKAVLRFVSDSSTTRSGFMAVFTATLGPDRGCGGQLIATNQSQKLIVPYDPTTKTYFNNMRCTWKISTSNTAQVIEVKLTTFEMEKKYGNNNESEECYDFMAIYDGPSSISPFLMKPTCELARDIELPYTINSSLHMIEVYFESDHSESFNGFELEYRATTEDCGGVYNAYERQAEITYESMRTATRTNQRQKRCRFFIRGTENEPIELKFLQFNFPSKTGDCIDEYLEVRDVGTIAECQHPACAQQQTEANNVIRSCGTHIADRFVSKTSLVQIVTSVLLQSQFSATFTLSYMLLDSCNRTITIITGNERWASGRITSPNFPNAYDHNATCITRIQVPQNKRIFIVFKSFSMERGAFKASARRTTPTTPVRTRRTPYVRFGLTYRQRFPMTCHDKLTITFNDSNPGQNETYCGWSPPSPQISPNNTVTLQLDTDGAHALTGYNAFYYTASVYLVIDLDSNYTFYNFSPIYERDGYVTSIGFPGYPESTIQQWTVIPPAGMTCAVRLISFMSRTRVCSGGDKAQWTHYMGDKPGPWIDLPCFDPYAATPVNLTAGERMMFTVTTDEYAHNNGLGFRATWNCVNSGTPVFMVDEWESSIDA